MSKVQEVSISPYIPHPLCVAGVFLTSLTSEASGSKVQHTSREAESLLLNVSGKLLMFQRDRSGPQIRENRENDNNHKHRVVSDIDIDNNSNKHQVISGYLDINNGIYKH